MPLLQQEQKYSYADYLTWNENERWEILDAVPYMQAAPSPTHQLILIELCRQFSNYLQGKPCRVYPAPFCVRLDINKNDNDVRNVFEPDISVVCDKSKIDKNGCNGAPNLIIEVMSPSSVKHDKITKFNKYEQAGVKEYWIVEPENKLVNVFILQENGQYGRTQMYSNEDKIKVSIFENLEIDLNTVFEE